jgi:nicotinamidase-related amidase
VESIKPLQKLPKMNHKILYCKSNHLQLILTLLLIILPLLPTDAYISPNIIFNRILSSMTNQNQNNQYVELKWKDAPLYAPKEEKQEEEEDAIKDLAPPRIPLKAESTVLLVVDVQPEYWTNCPSVRKDFPHFEENLKRTIDTCRKQKAKIIWVRADYRYYHSPWLTQFERLNSRNKRPDTTAELPCDPSSEDFAWEDFATPEGNEVVIAKKSWNSASNTALMDLLKTTGIENVLVCGLITSVCVQHSAFSVFEAGYRTLLVEDSCGDRGMARHQAALALYGNYMYEITSSRDLEDEKTGLQPAKPKWIQSVSFHNRGGNKRKTFTPDVYSDETSNFKRKKNIDNYEWQSNIDTHVSDDSSSYSNFTSIKE